MIHNKKIDSYNFQRLKEGQDAIFIDSIKEECLKKRDLIVFQIDDDSFEHEFITAAYKGVITSALSKEMICAVPSSRKVIMPLAISDKSTSLVNVIVTDKNKKILLCRLKERKTWDIPGGDVEKHESSMKTAQRILNDEVGLCLTDIEEMYKVCTYSISDININSDGIYCDIYVARIKNETVLPNTSLKSRMAENRMFDIYNANEKIILDDFCELTHSDIYAPLLCEIVNVKEAYLSNIRMCCDTKCFIASMLFPRKENEKYAVHLICENGDTIAFPKIYDSYFELFEYINRTKVREELSIDKRKNAIWEIYRFQNDKAVARWCLSMNNDILSANFYGDDAEEYVNFDFGKVYLEPDNVNSFYIYLSPVVGNKYSFLKVSIGEEGDFEFDLECNRSDKEFMCMQRNQELLPEIVSKLIEKLIADSHYYYILRFNFSAFSLWGEKEKHSVMKKMILQSDPQDNN